MRSHTREMGRIRDPPILSAGQARVQRILDLLSHPVVLPAGSQPARDDPGNVRPVPETVA